MDKKRIILIVEDDAVTRALLDTEFKKAGYEVYQAPDGEKGFEQIQKVQPHLVICDVVMPKMDGNQLYKKLQKTNFGANIPFVILTAHGAMKDYFEILGVDDFIVKPFKSEDLLARIEAVFNKNESSGNLPHAGHLSPDDVAKTIVYGEAVDKGKSVVVNYEPDSGTGLKAGGYGASQKKPSAKKRKKILLVEDDITVFWELQKIFSQYEYDTVVAQNMEDCLELVKQSPGLDLLIFKYYLNGGNAELLANNLKSMPQFKHIPIVIYEDIREKVSGKKSWERMRDFQLNAEGKNLVRKVQELLKR